MHVHRSPTSSDNTTYSEYYAVDAKTYDGSVPVVVVNGADRGDKKKTKKMGKVVAFIKGMMDRLERGGLLCDV
jgi:hypothetical protein